MCTEIEGRMNETFDDRAVPNVLYAMARLVHTANSTTRIRELHLKGQHNDR